MSDVNALRERLTKLFSTALNRDVPSIHTDLFETGVLDSLAFVELLVTLEAEFGVTTTVDDMEIDNFKSIACIAEFLRSRGVGAPFVPAERQAV